MRRLDVFSVVFTAFLLIIIPFFCVGESVNDSNIETSVYVENVGPMLIRDIPNFTWASNENFENAFNVSEYFEDYNGDEMTFNSSVPDNVTVVVGSDGMVSFYPAAGFSGVNTVTFYAFDSTFLTPSNLVYLNLGTDSEAPKWFNPSTSHVEVDQNDVVSFFTYWTDDSFLSNYIFSINEGGGWVNYTSVYFSGVGNNSNYSLQISAAPSSTVSWVFYASDTSGNYNVTDVQTFSVNALEVPPSTSGGGGAGDGDTGSGSSASSRFISSVLSSIGVDLQDPYDFSLDFSSLDIELLQGEGESVFLLIKNTGKYDLSLSFNLFDVSDLANLDENGFDLGVGESRELMIDFGAPKDYPPGQYYGFLQVTGHNRTTNIPIVITVKHYNPFLDFNLFVPPESELVNPGKNVSVIVNLSQRDYSKDFYGTLYLSVRDFEGNVYNFLEKEMLVGQKMAFIESLNVPDDSSEGVYLLYGRVEYENKSVLDSESFEVGYRFKFSAILNYSGILLLILILAFIFSVLMVKYRRGKKRERLLTLYLLLSQLRDRLNSDKLNEAAEIYIKLKHVYGEPVPKELLSDREFLKKELTRLGKVIKKPLTPESAAEPVKREEGDSPETKEGDPNEDKSGNVGDVKGEGDESPSEKKDEDSSEKKDEDSSENKEAKEDGGDSSDKKSVDAVTVSSTGKDPASSKSVSPSSDTSGGLPQKKIVKKVVKKIIKRVVPASDVKKEGENV